MKLTMYQVDAFASALFKGNPAAIVSLEKWLPDELMQKIGMENNLAETAFFVKAKEPFSFDIRWFTPESEINLCGHATLGSAYVLYHYLGYNSPGITFNSKSGPLFIKKKDQMIFLDFPSWNPERVEDFPPDLLPSLGKVENTGVYKNRDYIVELNTEEDVVKCTPDFSRMKNVRENVIITAPGKEVDFVSRFFAPSLGIDEDPVTGSAHSQLIPFWSYKLGRKKLSARQLSKRGGDLVCEQKDNRVMMGGTCAFYMKGELELPDSLVRES
jgi:PhzF family phenazine biosynthesis protein